MSSELLRTRMYSLWSMKPSLQDGAVYPKNLTCWNPSCQGMMRQVQL